MGLFLEQMFLRELNSGPLKNRGSCVRSLSNFSALSPSLVRGRKFFYRKHVLETRCIMICKLSGRDNTLATVHAKMKGMAGRNFLGSAIANEGCGWRSGGAARCWLGPEEDRGRSRWPGLQRQICSLRSRPRLALKTSQESAERRWVLSAI